MDPYADVRDDYFRHHTAEFSDHPPTQEWPCPTKECPGTMTFDLGMQGCYCLVCERYDGVK